MAVCFGYVLGYDVNKTSLSAYEIIIDRPSERIDVGWFSPLIASYTVKNLSISNSTR